MAKSAVKKKEVKKSTPKNAVAKKSAGPKTAKTATYVSKGAKSTAQSTAKAPAVPAGSTDLLKSFRKSLLGSYLGSGKKPGQK